MHHYSNTSCDALSDIYGRFMMTGELITWPPRSPDLTLLDLRLSGYVKSVIGVLVTSSDEHKKCVTAADDASSRDAGACWTEVE
jgi:hypothetical protein